MILTVVTCALFAAAEPRPQFTWEGQVDGIVVIQLHGKKLDLEYKQGPPVERDAYHFNSTLPDSRQDVRLEVRQGRGSVRITEQPRLENNYTASVTIEDRQDGAGFYSFALYWDTERGSFADEPDRTIGRTDRVTWSGHVDGAVVIECRESQCESKVGSGQPVTREKVKFSRPIPAQELKFFLDNTNGPADFRLLEQSGQTVRVQIRTLPGGGDCSFIVSWPRSTKKPRFHRL